MSSYTNIFGGFPTNPAYASFIAYNLTALVPQVILVWPGQFVDSANLVAGIMNINATQAGCSLVFPDATLVSVGQNSIIVNLSAYTITIYANDGTTILTTLAASTSVFMYLVDNTTTNGTFDFIPYGAGSLSPITSISEISTSSSLVITPSTLTSSGTFTFSLSGNLGPIDTLTGTGYLARTGTDTWALRTFQPTANQITISNPAGIAGNSTIALAANISGITSITASNLQIGVNGTNEISTTDSNPVLYSSSIGLDNTDLIFFDSTGIGFAAFQSPSGDYSTSVTYTLPVAPPPFSGYVLASTTAGVLSWTSSSAGGVTSATGTTNQIDVIPSTGAIVISIDPNYVGQTSITTLGTITTGVWDATPVPGSYLGRTILTSGTSATFTTSIYAHKLIVQGVGGGGGGGGTAGSGSTYGSAGGGGGGGYFYKTITTPAATYTYTVGAGGAGGTSGNNNGSSGGTTSFGSLSVTGGAGGGGSAATTPGSATLATGGAAVGGSSSSGDINISGTTGATGIIYSSNFVATGEGGYSPYGTGGPTITLSSTNVTNSAGSGFGGGGGGAGTYTSTNEAGGAGTGGLIIVDQYA